jgi:hypothetical protein
MFKKSLLCSFIFFWLITSCSENAMPIETNGFKKKQGKSKVHTDKNQSSETEAETNQKSDETDSQEVQKQEDSTEEDLAEETNKIQSNVGTSLKNQEDIQAYLNKFDECGKDCEIKREKGHHLENLKLYLYMDRSGSMNGFKNYFSSKMSGIVSSIEKSIKKDANISEIKFFSIKNRNIQEDQSTRWKNAIFDGASSDIDLAFDHFEKKNGDFAVIFTDGMPSYQQFDSKNIATPSKENSCVKPSNNFDILSEKFEKLIKKNYQIAIYHQTVPYEGKYYMNCGELSKEHKRNIQDEFNTKVECKGDKSSECFFKYKGTSPYLMILISKNTSEQPLHELIKQLKPFQNQDNTFKESMIKIWPPADASSYQLKRSALVNTYLTTEGKTIEIEISNHVGKYTCHQKAHEFVSTKFHLSKDEEYPIEYLVDFKMDHAFLGENPAIFANEQNLKLEGGLPENGANFNKFISKMSRPLACKTYYHQMDQHLKKFEVPFAKEPCDGLNYCQNYLISCHCLFYNQSSQKNAKKNIFHEISLKYQINRSDKISKALDDQSRVDLKVDPTKLAGWSEFLETMTGIVEKEMPKDDIQKFVLNLEMKKQ